jgi:hypothetical protein
MCNIGEDTDLSKPYDLADDTREIFKRLKPYRQQLEEILQNF